MSDLAKKCADLCRVEAGFARALGDGTPKAEKRAARFDTLAAFIEAAQALRDCIYKHDDLVNELCDCQSAYDAALRDLAQSMEVE